MGYFFSGEVPLELEELISYMRIKKDLPRYEFKYKKVLFSKQVESFIKFLMENSSSYAHAAMLDDTIFGFSDMLEDYFKYQKKIFGKKDGEKEGRKTCIRLVCLMVDYIAGIKDPERYEKFLTKIFSYYNYFNSLSNIVNSTDEEKVFKKISNYIQSKKIFKQLKNKSFFIKNNLFLHELVKTENFNLLNYAIEAIDNGNTNDELRKIIKYRDSKSRNLLNLASYYGWDNGIERVIKISKKHNLLEKEELSKNLLIVVNKGYIKSTELFIKHNAPVEYNHLLETLRIGDKDIFVLLFKNLNGKLTRFEREALLFDSMENYNIDIVVYITQKTKVSKNHIRWAIENDKPELLKILLESKPTPKTRIKKAIKDINDKKKSINKECLKLLNKHGNNYIDKKLITILKKQSPTGSSVTSSENEILKELENTTTYRKLRDQKVISGEIKNDAKLAIYLLLAYNWYNFYKDFEDIDVSKDKSFFSTLLGKIKIDFSSFADEEKYTSLLHEVVKTKNLNLLNFSLEKLAKYEKDYVEKVLEFRNLGGLTPIDLALYNGLDDATKTMLKSHKGNYPFGDSSLLIVIQKGYFNSVKLLIENNVSIEYEHLKQAISTHHEAIFELLFNKKSNLKNKEKSNLLSCAIKNNNFDIISFLVDEVKVPIPRECISEADSKMRNFLKSKEVNSLSNQCKITDVEQIITQKKDKIMTV